MRKFIIIICLIIAGGLFSASSVLAITISPPRIELEGDPGQVLNGKIKLTNEKNVPETLYANIEDFTAKGEGGEPAFVGRQKEYGLSNWINIASESVHFAPGETKKVPFWIEIPKNAEPGGHYAAIFWGTAPPELSKEGKVTIGIASKVGSLVLIRVSGEIKESGRLLEFKLENKKTFSHLPVDFLIRFENSGNVHLMPQGEITIENMLGKKSGLILINKPGGNVLPETIRKFESSWLKKDLQEAAENENFIQTFIREIREERNNFALGKYNAYLSLNFGRNSQVVNTSLSFWVIPWRLLVAGILGLIILLLVLRFAIRKYNQWIINKAKNSQS